MKKKLIVVSIVLSFCIFQFLAADLLDDLEKFKTTNGKMYLQPFADALTSSMNSGWFTVAKGGMPHFGFSINPLLTFIPDDEKTFMAVTPDSSHFEEHEVETATVFGKKDAGGTFHSKTIGVDNIELPGGIDLSALPFVIPQAHVGLPSGFEVQARFFPEVELSKDIGKVSYWGFGIKNQISKMIPLCPLAIAVQGTYQQFSLGNFIDMNTTFFNLQASKSLIVVPLTVYGGIGMENSTLTAKYDYNGPITSATENVKFDLETENEIRITVGTRLKLLIFDFMADYSLAKYSTLRLGIGASF